MSIFISGSWKAYSVLNTVCLSRISFLCFSGSKSLEDLIKSFELLLSIEDVTFISRLFFRHKVHLCWTAGPHSSSMSLELSHITAEMATAVCA